MKNSELKESLIKLAESMEGLITEIEAEQAQAQEKTASVKTASDLDFGKVSTGSKTAATNPLLDFLLS
jgi:hypothetical protein